MHIVPPELVALDADIGELVSILCVWLGLGASGTGANTENESK